MIPQKVWSETEHADEGNSGGVGCIHCLYQYVTTIPKIIYYFQGSSYCENHLNSVQGVQQ